MQKVKIYTTSTCHFCHMAKDFFRDKGIKFEEINLDNNDKAIEELVERTGRYGVPVIEIGKELIIGFNKTKIEALLK